LLRTRREWPSRRAAEQRDEVAPFYLTEMHPIPSRAGSTSQDTGLQRISQRVCERFTTRGSLLERPSLTPGAKPQLRLNRKSDLTTQQNSAKDFHRHHRARSVVCARAGSTEKR